MAVRSDYEIRVVPSVLDRLIDLEPTSPHDPPASRADSLDAFRRAVMRDLEHLLNTRNPLYDLPSEFAELGQSVASFGLPDFSTLNLANPNDQQRLRQLIETTLRAFEPRLKSVVASLLPSAKTDRTLRLRVEARLIVDPTPEPVAFDISVPWHTRQSEVKESLA